jgi:hypothetical protein
MPSWDLVAASKVEARQEAGWCVDYVILLLQMEEHFSMAVFAMHGKMQCTCSHAHILDAALGMWHHCMQMVLFACWSQR